ncbi:hypothetical protein AB0G42_00255 [Streptomyces yangpuensis]|uniref:hypothetical protein n=1 Tax=Streptomyces yangpuensis TaxID=1648182 RepID=UPI00342B662B
MRAPLLKELGAADVLIDDGALATQVAEREIGVDTVFDVVGNSVLRDSPALVRPRDRACRLGFLGGFEPVRDLDPIADLPSGVRLRFFGRLRPGHPLVPAHRRTAGRDVRQGRDRCPPGPSRPGPAVGGNTGTMGTHAEPAEGWASSRKASRSGSRRVPRRHMRTYSSVSSAKSFSAWSVSVGLVWAMACR